MVVRFLAAITQGLDAALPIAVQPLMSVLSPDAVVGIPIAHVVRLLFPSYFRSVKFNIVVGGNVFFLPFLGQSLEKISTETSKKYETAQTTKTSAAAILFTTGSTGPAKGVLYEHGMFGAQVRMLNELYKFKPGELNLPGLPIFALFDVALAMTCVIPDINPAHPARVEPSNII